jgi:uncharacterized protein with HEPN domain
MSRLEPDSDDVVFLWDMREAGLGIIRLTRGVAYADFCTDAALIVATERALSIIGGAARMVTSQTRDAHGEIAWRELAGIARLLDDEDEALEQEELWAVIQSLPGLVRALSALMPEADDDV